MNKLNNLWIAVALLAACGDDDAGAPPPRPAAPPAAAAKAKGAKGQLAPREHIEDKIACPVPDAPTGHPACTPLDGPAGAGSGKMLPECDPGTYCTQVANTWTCEPCAERESIRHEFKDRDFVEDQARDPFQSFVVPQLGLGNGSNTAKPEPHQSCKRADQFVASNYSYQDLRLVGIVAQATQRKVLMMDPGGVGRVIKRGDCVGKEKAVVKDIGTGYITFVVEEDPDTKRPATETSIQLHPGGVEFEVTSQPTPTSTPMAPVVSPSNTPANPIRR
ncbi:MAG: pilus assembly protein PilP [Kofleriaceae bacterium]